MSRQAWNETLSWVTADGTAVASTTSATAIFNNITIPANYMQDGRVLRVRAFGKYSTNTSTTPGLTFSIYYNGTSGTLLAATEAFTTGSGVSNVNWSLEALIQTRSNGSSGSLIVLGDARIQTNASGDPTSKVNIFGVSGSDAPAAVSSLNLATDWPLTLAATWGTSHANNTLTGMIYTVESLN
jgi:hypothetical protein